MPPQAVRRITFGEVNRFEYTVPDAEAKTAAQLWLEEMDLSAELTFEEEVKKSHDKNSSSLPTKHENAVWYSKEELDQMYKDVMYELNYRDEFGSNAHCEGTTLGLDHLKKGSDTKRRKAIKKVIEAYQKQIEKKGYCDPEKLESISKKESKSAREKAEKRGFKCAADLKPRSTPNRRSSVGNTGGGRNKNLFFTTHRRTSL